MYIIKKKFLEFLLSVQNFLKSKKKNEPKSNIFKTEHSKNVLSDGASLNLNAQTEATKKEVEKLSEELVKKNFGDVNKTLELLQTKNIKVYRTKFVTDILKYINEQPGFITPQKGLSAIYLNFMLSLFCDKKIMFKNTTEEIFVFSVKDIDEYFLASQIYKFVAFRKNMPGFEEKTQKMFKKMYKNPKKIQSPKLTAGDIFAVKEALARDVEAADFAFKLHEETEKDS